MTSKNFEELNERMLMRVFDVNPHLATQFGRHDPYDYHLPHGGVKRLTDTMDVLDEWHNRALALAQAEDFTFDERISLEVLRVASDTQRFAVEDYPLWQMLPDAFELPGYAFLVMLNREYWPLDKRLEAITSRIEELPRYLKEFRTRFEGESRPITLWTDSAITSCADFPRFLESLTEESKGKLSAAAFAKLEAAAEQAIRETAFQLQWLKLLRESAIDDFHMGKEKFARLLVARGFPYTPEETLEIATKLLDEMRADKSVIIRRMTGPGTAEAAYEIVRSNSAKDFDAVMKETQKVVDAAKEFVQKKGLATIDPAAILTIVETPEFMSEMVTTAATDLPAPFEDVPRGIYVQTRPKTEDELKGVWNHAMIVNTAVHEAYPGHFHQGVMSLKSPWMHQLLEFLMTSDTIVTAYETQEGWAHYCERMMYDQGFEHSDPAALIMLDGAIWRAVRAIADVRLAYGDATIMEMAELMSKEASTPFSAADSDVKGFSRAPGYGLSYLMGRHMVFELKKELQERLGERFELRKFHDLLALNGNLPFFLAKEAVMRGFGIDSDRP